MMLKKMLIVIPLVLCALVGQSESIAIGDFTYSYSLSTKEGSITKYNGSSENVVIPSTFSAPETYKDNDGETHMRHHTITVTAIGDSAFQNNTTIKSVLFHDKLKTIGWQAFYGCWNLRSDIEVPYVTAIDSRAFQGAGIRSIKTSSALKSLGSLAFWNCGNLQEADIDGTELNLNGSSGLFRDCQNLKKVTFGNGVISLYLQNGSGWGTYSGTFGGCTNLQSVIVGSGVTSVPASFLYGAGNERDRLSVSFASPVTNVGNDAFCNSNITNIDLRLSNCTVGSYAFAYCGAEMRGIDFSQVTSLGNSAFCGCWNLQRDIDLSNATYIDTRAFQGAGIKTIKTSTELKTLGSMAFWNCGNLREAEINGTGLDLFNATMLFSSCPNLTRVSFGDGVSRLPNFTNGGSSPFSGCTNLREFSVGSGVTEVPSRLLSSVGSSDGLSVSFNSPLTAVGYSAFYSSSITNLDIRLSNCKIDDYAFCNCRAAMTSVDFLQVSAIGGCAFENCWNIKGNIDLSNVATIGGAAFAGCSGITGIKTSEKCTRIGASAFRYCGGLELAEINGTALDLNGATSLFEYCSSLQHVVIGDGVSRLPNFTNGGYSPFRGCTNLREFSVGSGVTEVPSRLLSSVGSSDGLSVSFNSPLAAVGYSAFYNGNITNLDIRLSRCSVAGYAFSGCPAVSERNIDFTQIASIGESAFYACGGIRGNLDISNATSIGSGAFQNCAGITSAKIGSGVSSVGSSAFRSCSNLSSLTFLGAPPQVGNYAFNNVKSGATGTYTAAHVAEWEAVIDSKGYWNGLKMKPSYYTVIYNANNGTGETFSQTVEWGEAQQAADGTFTWEGHYFMGWAFAPDGEVAYAVGDAVAEPTDDRVVRVYAKWSKLTLTAESANWSSGSITLRCEDTDTSGAEHSYTLEYCNENGTWVAVDDVQKSVTRGQNANNEEVWVARLTDSAFTSRLGGIPPVQYHVKEVKSGRVSETCVTRNRHAIFVGLNEWQDTDLKPTGGDRDANDFFNIAALRGGFSNSENIHVLLNGGAKADDVDDAFDRVAESVQTGDIFLFYFRTHGGYDKSDGTTFLCLYDEDYTDTTLAKKIQSIEATGKSVAIIGIVAACHAGGMYDPDARLGHWYVANGLARCSANIAWIAAADREHTSYAVFNKFLLDYGWEEGWAGNDTRLSFLELATYTKDRYESLLSGIKSYEGWEVQIENPLLLRNVMAGTRGSHANKKPPAAVTGIKSETGDRVDEIKTEWNAVDNADGYWLFCETGGVNAVCAAYSCRVNETEVSMSFQKLFGDLEFDPSKLPIKYSVKTVNGAGVSVASTVEVQNFARIVFDANGGGISGWRGALPREGIVYADITIGSILGGRLLTLPDAYGEDNKEFTGWFSVNGVQANPMAPIASDETYLAKWKAKNANGMTQDWLDSHQTIASASNGDIATAAAMSAANGCRTVGECYALGINPEDPNDDLRIAAFKMEDGKPVIMLNHTEDGSGNSFLPRVKTLGKATLSDVEEWREVPEEGDQTMHFFKVQVEMP